MPEYPPYRVVRRYSDSPDGTQPWLLEKWMGDRAGYVVVVSRATKSQAVAAKKTLERLLKATPIFPRKDPR